MRTLVMALCLLGAGELRGDGRITTSDGVAIHFLEHVPKEAASDLTLVFIPGWMMPATIWSHQLEAFRSTHRVLAIHPRSQGDSGKPAEGHFPARRAIDLRELLEQKKLERVILIAAASGVTDAAAYVDQFGTDRLAGLVLVHGVAGADYDSATLLGLVKWAQRFQADRPAQTEALVRSLFSKPRTNEEISRLTAEALKMPTAAAMAAMVGSLAADYRPALAKIDKPVLIVAGDSRWHEQYVTMQRSIPGARLEKIANTGHGLYVEAATEFNQMLRDFLAQTALQPVDRRQ